MARKKYKVLATTNTLYEGKFVKAGTIISVPKSYYQRIISERDNQFKAL